MTKSIFAKIFTVFRATRKIRMEKLVPKYYASMSNFYSLVSKCTILIIDYAVTTYQIRLSKP